MTTLSEARSHLAKAKEFLVAAESNLDDGYLNAATSNAVTSGINAKDAMCLRLTGRTSKSDNHSDAVDDLRRAGRAAAAHATTLRRLLGLKNRSQYDTRGITAGDASKAVHWARTLHQAAVEIVTG
jgi:uncharacterized protein (UPF0332 family)